MDEQEELDWILAREEEEGEAAAAETEESRKRARDSEVVYPLDHTALDYVELNIRIV
jgi:hypothetical protein